MLKTDTVIFKSLKNFAAKSDLGVHHIFFNINSYKAFLSGNTGNCISRDAAGTFYDHGTIILWGVGIADVDRNPGFADWKDSIFMEYRSTHVS